MEGRLQAHEFEQRLERLLASRTLGELDGLVRDLPGKRLARRGPLELVSVRTVAITVAVTVVAVAVLVAVATALAGIVSGWLVWLVLIWFFAGRRHRHHGHIRRL
jgi:hypothetical protein